MSHPLEKRFLDKYEPVTESGCWIWTGPVGTRYGNLTVNKRSVSAHRIAWEIFKGPIPASLCVCHSCDVLVCVRPDHLFLGTHAENMDDKIRKGRHNTPRGCAHPKSKLSESDALFIRDGGAPSKLLSAQYGISVTQVNCIKRRALWKHLP